MAFYWVLVLIAVLSASQMESRIVRQAPDDPNPPDAPEEPNGPRDDGEDRNEPGNPFGGNGNGQTTGGGGVGTETTPAGVVSTPGGGGSFAQIDGKSPPVLNCAHFSCLPMEQILDDNGSALPTRINPPMDFSAHPECLQKPAVGERPCHYNLGDPSSHICYGVECLKVSQDNDYCICSPEQIGHQCAILKPGTCDSATGFLPPKHYLLRDKRFRRPGRVDHGNVYSRHYAASEGDCVKLCQWASPRCTAINYGSINDYKVCELLSVVVTNGSIMHPWLTSAPGWVYTTVVGKAATV